MSNLNSEEKKKSFEIIHPTPEHFGEIQDLCRRVYPFTKPWSVAQLESHQAHFPDGQLIALDRETNKVLGLAFSLIVSWDDYSPQDSWMDFTGGGFFHNHNPRKGKTLYGAEVMVDPECRGQGIGKALYRERENIAREYGLKRIRAGARLRGYQKKSDEMSAEEYTREVIQNKFFDPTLSFQLGAGFEVLSVARNYLFNDPESLGFAAVIEWLNPDVATEADYRKHRDAVAGFLQDEIYIPHLLPKELRLLVRRVTVLLGQTIKEFEGEKFFQKTEKYRSQLKKMRRNGNLQSLQVLSKKLRSESNEDQLKLAHGFSLLMELINVCEAAYRTWRLQQKPTPNPLTRKVPLSFVLTSHPTEARSPLVLDLLKEISELLVWGLQSNFDLDGPAIQTKLRFLWKLPMTKSKSPSVLDEAESIFSLVLQSPILDFVLSEKQSYELNLRTWVGGDKDGHPGVTAEVMRSCLEASRVKLLSDINDRLREVKLDLVRLGEASGKIDRLIKDLGGLKSVKAGDAERVRRYKEQFKSVIEKQGVFVKGHSAVLTIFRLFKMFPGLVLPIELREDSGVIEKALNCSKPSDESAISEMLKFLGQISKSGSVLDYARGFVVSHCESDVDVDNACRLVNIKCDKTLPVVPLFESRQALISARDILKSWLLNFQGESLVQKNWGGKLEVMLGYSDSAKEIGVIGSRKLICESMFKIESTLKRFKIKPVFFHGSGGSVARGGGSLKEQITWWSGSAVRRPKLTIQGEMIQRTFATEEILNSQALHLSREAQLRRGRKVKPVASEAFDKYVNGVEVAYRELVSNLDRLEELLSATPYAYLEVLKLGSRPSKRKANFSLDSLRAIPWVLCWTQTRLLLPVWWGVGSSWKNLSPSEKEELQNLFREDAFFSSFVKSLGFTLAKVEMPIWRMYLSRVFSASQVESLSQLFAEEYKYAVKFVLEVSGQKSLVWYRPWLEESIKLRGAYIHLLNLLQIVAMERGDEKLLRKTLLGISSGMLTTG